MRELVLDDEACVLLPDGRSSRGRRSGARAILVKFDLLRLDGEDTGRLPLE